jgi:hypothetical protein
VAGDREPARVRLTRCPPEGVDGWADLDVGEAGVLEQVIEGLVGAGAPEAADRDDDSDVR